MSEFDYEFDERTGNTFHMDYCANFFDLIEADIAGREVLQRDFTFNLADFLNGKLELDMNTAFAIAKRRRIERQALKYAEVNWALGIMFKEGRGKSLITQLSSGCVTQPRRIRIGEIRQTSSKRLIKTMFN